MSSSNKHYTITEYGGFTCTADYPGYKLLSVKTFNALEAFILANNANNRTEAVELLSLSARRGVGKIITARNYVGIITMADGTVIEILPKIVSSDITEEDTRRIFLEMLRTLKDVSFKEFNISHLHTDRMNLFEIFIKMFLHEVTILTKQGIKAAYTPVEANERYYKGKLLASQNIKYNLVNRERFFVGYDDFNINRPENRLIKSTLHLLHSITNDEHNSKQAMILLNYFDGVDYSTSYDADFARCANDRSMEHYQKALSWCRVFLKGESFTSFAGSEVALALLFPMEKVFESFIATKIRKHIDSSVIMRTQDSKYSLFDDPTRSFSLRPDIVLEFDWHTVVLDTKWKLLSDNARNRGISQSDMYQMYAYGKKYKADSVYLLYPKSDAASELGFSFSSNDNVKVNVAFVDLKNADSSISNLLAELFMSIL